MVKHQCNRCLKIFIRKNDLIYHLEKKKKPCQHIINDYINNIPNIPKNEEKSTKSTCNDCGKSFSTKFNLNKHIKLRCKGKKESNQNNKLNLEVYLQLQNDNKKLFEEIKEIKKLYEEFIKENQELLVTDDDFISEDLIINEKVIKCRESDYYVNATQLCKSDGKKLNDWVKLESTKELIKELDKNINKNNPSNQKFTSLKNNYIKKIKLKIIMMFGFIQILLFI